jgi:hypothetical protein
MQSETILPIKWINQKMSLLDQMMSELGQPLIEEFLADAEENGVLYFHPDGTPAGCFTATLAGERQEEIFGMDGSSRSWKQVRSADFPHQEGLPFWTPNVDIGTFAIGEVVYALESVESLTANSAVVRLVRIGLVEQAKAGYRKK